MAVQKKPHPGCSTGHGSMLKIRYIIIPALFLCVAALGLGCTKKQEPVKADKIINVKVWKTEKRSVRPFIETVGSLEPNDNVTISSEVDGILKDIKVDEGTPVVKGMTLATIKDTDYRLNLENARSAFNQAEASLANTKIEFERKEALLKEELITRQQFDDVSTRLTLATHDSNRARSLLSLAKERFDKTVIYSPIKGTVKEKMVSAGDFARASVPIMSIVQIDPLKLSFSVAEKDVGALKKNQDVIFTVDPFPGKEFSGRLNTIYPSLDERSRTLKAEALVPNPSQQLKPGLFARVKIYTGDARNSVLIPITSILYEGTRTRAFVSEKDTAHERAIKLGSKYGEMMEVLEGIQAGEQLVVVGQNTLTDGVKIHAVK